MRDSDDPKETPQSEERVIVVRELTKIFKDFWGRDKARAVNRVDFEVRRGEVFGLLGPNGSGKSTTIKMLLGLLRPTSGLVEVLGRSPEEVSTKSRIGYLPEESYLYPYFSGMETLDFFGKLFGLSVSERRVRGAQLLEMVGLSGSQTRSVGEYSKGMQRRIGIALALINDPELVILDEPTAGLDPIGCREVKDLIQTLARRGKTVVLSSHLLADVEDVCDRVVIYYGGRVHAMGELKRLLATPGSLRFTVPTISRQAVERLISYIRSEVVDAEIEVEAPMQDLEGYFISVVQRARACEAETAGATAGRAVADYLGGPTEDVGRRKLLDRLMHAEVDTGGAGGTVGAEVRPQAGSVEASMGARDSGKGSASGGAREDQAKAEKAAKRLRELMKGGE